MNTRIRNKRTISRLEEKVRQGEQNLASVILEQADIIKHMDEQLQTLYKNQKTIIEAFGKDIDGIKQYGLQHMKEFHPNAHKSFFNRLKGGK